MIRGEDSRQLIDSLAEGRDLGIVVGEELKPNKHAQTAAAKHLRLLTQSSVW